MKKLYTLIIILLSISAKATPPTVPASDLGFFIIDGGYFNVGWTAGNGAKRIMICKAGSPVSFIPQNGVDYSENTILGSGQQVAPGEFVVYDNAFTSFYVTGLSPATQYFFAVFEYNGTGATSEYLTSSFLTGTATTSSTPTVQVTAANFTSISATSVNFDWTIGNGQRRLVVVRQGSAVNADPVNNHQYAVSSVFGNGEAVGAGNFTVYASTGNSSTVTNLQPNTQYFFSFYEFNGSGQPQYKLPAYTASVTTRSMPTIASSNIVITKVDGKELDLSWTNGNGQRRIIIAKKGSAVTSVPVDGTDYNANSIFGTGQQLATGEFVVFDDNFNAANVTGLDPASIYFFKIFEYDGTGANTIYLTALSATINAGTAVTPTLQASNISATGITGNSLNLIFTAGNGRARMVVAHKNSAVNATIQDFTAYIHNSDFGSGQDLGAGNFVISNTTDVLVAVHNLEPNTTYHFAIFEFNGFNQPLYLSPAAVFSATTLGAVPVTLTRWEATVVQHKVKLEWTTSNEINSSHFTIERSSDGLQFSAIANLLAVGNSNAQTNYNKEDADPLPGKSFYRLRMVDKDGQSTYSPIRTVLFTAKQTSFIAANPAGSELTVVNATADGKTAWQIIAANGQVIRKGEIKDQAARINIVELKSGCYWLKLYGKNQVLVIPFSRF
ncbi:MAG: T9SS type A sorting domain-containing protein [Ferruginibacter sp.]